MKSIIITGAGGFIGSSLVRTMAGKYKIYAILHNGKERQLLPERQDVIPIVGDLNDWETQAYSGYLCESDVNFNLKENGTGETASKIREGAGISNPYIFRFSFRIAEERDAA